MREAQSWEDLGKLYLFIFGAVCFLTRFALLVGGYPLWVMAYMNWIVDAFFYIGICVIAVVIILAVCRWFFGPIPGES